MERNPRAGSPEDPVVQESRRLCDKIAPISSDAIDENISDDTRWFLTNVGLPTDSPFAVNFFPFKKAQWTHSEKLIADRLEHEEIKPEKVDSIHSDREFGVWPGHNCKALVTSKYQQAVLTYHLPKEVSSSNAEKAIGGWLISGEQLRPFEVDEHKVREGRKTAMENALLHPGASPGGIDFSSLELRYMVDPGPGANRDSSMRSPRHPPLRTIAPTSG